jgi:outer membrane protein assembly factor BamB
MYRDAVSAGLVVVAFNGRVIALRRDDGARVWVHEELAPSTMRVEVVGDQVYALGNGHLVCLELANGQQRWRASALGSTLLVAGDQVFVGGSGEVACYAASDGARQWSDGFTGMGLGEVAIAVDGRAAQADLRK